MDRKALHIARSIVIKKYGKENIHFKVKDIILEEYPKTDLIICRDGGGGGDLINISTSYGVIFKYF